jgi:aspartate/methionine/tyrosine aminotransferase
MITTDFTLNPNVARMKPSATLAISARAAELKRQGVPIIGLSAGEPDFDTPKPICEAAIRAIEDGFTRYTPNTGTLELRSEICTSLASHSGLDYAPDQILCSNGAKQSVALATMALCRPDDEVIIPAPYWVSYPEMVTLAGAKPAILETTVNSDYRMSAEDLESAITQQTRLLILCSPSNPTGAVYEKAELEAIAAVLRRHEQVYVISDEIYQHISYDTAFTSFAVLPGMKERTITVNGFSKAFAMTGWRLGYLAAELPITKACAKIQGQTTSAPCSITQKAGVAALKMDHRIVLDMVDEFRVRRDFLHRQLCAIRGVKCPLPEGAFYLFPDISSFFGKSVADRSIDSSSDLCLYLMEEHNVALVPGDAFGAPRGMRISYAASMDELEEAARRIAIGLQALSHG